MEGEDTEMAWTTMSTVEERGETLVTAEVRQYVEELIERRNSCAVTGHHRSNSERMDRACRSPSLRSRAIAPLIPRRSGSTHLKVRRRRSARN